MAINRYNTSSMKVCANKIDEELEAYESYRKHIDHIINTLNQNWDDDLNQRYVSKYKSEFSPAAEKIGKNIKQYANVMHQCAKRYGSAIDNGNSKFSSS